MFIEVVSLEQIIRVPKQHHILSFCYNSFNISNFIIWRRILEWNNVMQNIDKPLVVYIFSGNVMTSITALRT